MAIYKMGFFELRTEAREGSPLYRVVSHTVGHRDVLIPSPIEGYQARGIAMHPDEVVLHEGDDLPAAQAFYDECWAGVDNKPPVSE
jgi:hypothetical protein